MFFLHINPFGSCTNSVSDNKLRAHVPRYPTHGDEGRRRCLNHCLLLFSSHPVIKNELFNNIVAFLTTNKQMS